MTEALSFGRVEGGLAPLPLAPRQVVAAFAVSDPTAPRDGGPPLCLDMAGADLTRLNSGRAPVLADHLLSLSSVIGGVERAWTENETAFALLRFATTNEGHHAWRLIQDGFGRCVSVAYRFAPSDIEPMPGGARLLRRWHPYEISIVAVPASWRCRVLPQDEGEAALARHRAAEVEASLYRRDAGARECARDFARAASAGLASRLGADPQTVAEALQAEADLYRWGDAKGAS